MSNQYAGVGLHWGTDIVPSFISGQYKVQSSDWNRHTNKYTVDDGDGNTVGLVYYNATENLTIEFIPTSSSSINGNLNPTFPSIGTEVTVTDANFTADAGTNWFLDDISTKRTNKGALVATLKLSRYDSIS